MDKKNKVVITGMSGRIGRIIYEHLKHHWALSGVDIKPSEGLPLVVADINDHNTLTSAFKETYAVIHLAANSNAEASWDEIVSPNILGTRSVFEAARCAGVSKVIFASSNRVTGLYEKDEPYRSIAAGRYDGFSPNNIPQINHTMPIRPDGYYGISKAFGEALGRYYAEALGMQVICLRIGVVNQENRPRSVREYATLLTHKDLVALIDKCLKNQEITFDIFYGVSFNKWKFWDTSHATDKLGWTPEEDAEMFRL